jgi:hypothetical protein
MRFTIGEVVVDVVVDDDNFELPLSHRGLAHHLAAADPARGRRAR